MADLTKIHLLSLGLLAACEPSLFSSSGPPDLCSVPSYEEEAIIIEIFGDPEMQNFWVTEVGDCNLPVKPVDNFDREILRELDPVNCRYQLDGLFDTDESGLILRGIFAVSNENDDCRYFYSVSD